MDVVFPPSSRRWVDAQLLGETAQYTAPSIYPVIAPYLPTEPPRVCLDLGCGLGRMSLALYQRQSWPDTEFILLDADGDTPQYGIRHREQGDFYNSMEATADFCEANGLINRFMVARPNDIPQCFRPVDLVYSFLAIGFHWHLDLYLDRLLTVTRPGTRCIFQIRRDEPRFRSFVDEQLSFATSHPCYDVIQILRHPHAHKNALVLEVR